MASVKVKVRASSAYDKSGTIYYQIIHRRTVKQISTGIRIDTSRWDNLRQQQNSPQPISLHPDR